MNAVSVYPALVIVFIAVLSAGLLNTYFPAHRPPAKYATIDGLRGYLALFVFICHGCAYYYYFHTGQWTEPPSNLYSQFGYTSVALFFMITGFLFSGKLIEARTQPIDWTRFFVSRVLRLVPLYFAVLAVVLLIVGIRSDFTLQEPLLRVIKRIIHWAAFTVIENPDINEVKDTWIITAGVMWTFTYEWLFYLSLPLVGLLFYRSNYSVFILLMTLSLCALIVWKKELFPVCFLPFAGGMAASFLVRSAAFCSYASKKAWGFLVVLLLTVNTFFFYSSFEPVPVLLLSFAFVLIACGNTLFGLLTHPISYTLGRMSYSIYLLHGPLLFVVFHFITDPRQAPFLSPLQHWLIVAASTPVLMGMSYLTYTFIEQPAMDASPSAAASLKKNLRIKLSRTSKK